MVAHETIRTSLFAVLCMTSCMPVAALADGMVPDTTVVIVHESEGEAAVKVTNSDAKVALLHVRLENIPEDPETLLFVTPQLARVEPGKQQLVRFVLANNTRLRTQRLKRVIFEGIPQARSSAEAGKAQVGVTVAQNLPVIIHPKELAKNREPWTGLTWSKTNGAIEVRNDTPYVVRLAQRVDLLPSNTQVSLPRSYVLPGERLSVPTPTNAGKQDTSVRLYPATVYGFAVDAYEAPLR